MMVEIEQSNAENPPDAERIVGEIKTVVQDDDASVQGAKVKLQSGATGYVKRVVTDE